MSESKIPVSVSVTACQRSAQNFSPANPPATSLLPLKVRKKPPPVPPRRKGYNYSIPSASTPDGVKQTVIGLSESHVFVRTPSSETYTSTITRTRTVAELAQRFLEENVRNSIKPRIYPMENSQKPVTRVPTPFVFTSDVMRVRNEEKQNGGKKPVPRPRLREGSKMVALSPTCREKEYAIPYPLGQGQGQDAGNRKFKLYGNLKPSYAPCASSLYDYGLDFLHSARFLSNISLADYGKKSLTTTAAATSSAISLMMMGSPAHTRKSSGSSSQQQQQAPQQNDFASLLRKWSAPIPPVLSRKLGRVSDSPLGKVKVMLRICDSGEEMSANGILGVDQRRKQVTLIDPGGANGSTCGGGSGSGEERRVGVSAPKMFAFDGIFGEDDDQAEICAASAAELVASVVGGEDGCFVSLGYCTTGKKQTMFGRAVNQKVGIVPIAISWLFKSIQERKEKTGSRFSVRVSALEVTGGSGHEVINDLLLPFVNDDEQAPSSYLLDSKEGSSSASTATSSGNGSRTPGSFPKPQPVLNTVSEVRAPNPVAAGFFLDNAIAAMNNEDPVRHIVFTLHVYQYTIDKNGKGVVGGRSRLHCVMLGNGSPSISVLGGLLLAVLNGQRHLPSRESKLGAILRECLGSLTCRAVIMIHVGHRRRCVCSGSPDGKAEDGDNADASRIVHVSNAKTRYAETLAALQLGSRVHRLRRSRRLKMGSVGSGNGSGGSSGGSGEEMRNVLGNGLVSSACLEGGETGSSDIDPSSSDLSCDTVIYLGPAIDDATDGEHPPIYLPSLDGDDDTIDHKLMSPKCIHSNGSSIPKAKSPKPKTIANKPTSSEEQWVDGPKVSKYSPSAINNNHRGAGILSGSNAFPNGDVTAIKKSETWIDGPAAARVSHQANNFPSPKKTNHHHKMRLDTNPCSISSTKAAMIQEWISNQTHSGSNFIDQNHHLSESNSSLFAPSPSSDHARNSRTDYDPLLYGCAHGVYPQYMYSPYLHSIMAENGGLEPEYKSLTVFKTCGDIDEQDECPSNGYEFEYIEVIEPDVPVPTRDACFQVTEEDIALSFLEENPLPESDQNFSMGVDAYYFSNGNGRSGSSCSNYRGKELTTNNPSPSQFPATNGGATPTKPQPTNINARCYDSSISSAASTCTLTEKSDDGHPLRILSQECLTVVSTFADSASVGDEDMDRLWPRFSFPNDLTCQQQSHSSGICHGLCRNLASLSQMSLTSNGCCESAITPSKLTSSTATISKLTNANSKQPILDKKVLSAPAPPKLSDDSIYKIPGNPVFVKIRKMKSEASDTEEESSTTGGIPPMKLLDLTPIKNNLVTEDVKGGKPCLNSPKTGAGVVLTKPQPQHAVTTPPAHAGCDHNHHQNQHNHQHPNLHQQTNINNNNSKMNGLNCNSGGSLSRPTTGNLASHTSTTTADNSNKDNAETITNGVISTKCTPPTSPLPLHIPSSEVFTKSPSKSRSRRIAKFFRSNRSKSPKATPTKIPTTSSSESSGKSSSASTISAETASSDSSSGLGSFPSPTTKSSNGSSGLSCIKSPKHQSPNRRSSATLKNQALLLKSNHNSGAVSNDYQFTCDHVGTTIPSFLPSPTAQKEIHETS